MSPRSLLPALLPIVFLFNAGTPLPEAQAQKKIAPAKKRMSLVAKVKHKLGTLTNKPARQADTRLRQPKRSKDSELPSWFVPTINRMHSESLKKYGVAIDDIHVRSTSTGDYLSLSLPELDSLQSRPGNQWTLQRGAESIVVETLQITYIKNLLDPPVPGAHGEGRSVHTWSPNVQELRSGQAPAALPKKRAALPNQGLETGKGLINPIRLKLSN